MVKPILRTNFSAFSFGFRPNKSAHHAVLQAQSILNEGKVYVVELDLEKFFDTVNHDKLMNLLMGKVSDKGTLKFMRQYLRSGIMEGRLVSQRTRTIHVLTTFNNNFNLFHKMICY